MKLIGALDAAGIELIAEGALSPGGGRGVTAQGTSAGAGVSSDGPLGRDIPHGAGVSAMAVAAELWCIAVLLGVASWRLVRPSPAAGSRI